MSETINETGDRYADETATQADFHVIYLNHRGGMVLSRVEVLDGGDARIETRFDARTGKEMLVQVPASLGSQQTKSYRLNLSPGLNCISREVLDRYGPTPEAALDFTAGERPHNDPGANPPPGATGAIVDFFNASPYEIRDWLRVCTNPPALRLLRRLETRPEIKALLAEALAELDASSPEAGVRAAEAALEAAADRLAAAQREAVAQ